MKSFILKILVLAGFFIPVQYLYSQQIDLTLKYNTTANAYEVYAKPDFTQNNFYFGGGSQVTVLLPSASADLALAITTVNGGPWVDNSQIHAPSADTAHDFHGIATNGSTVNFTAGIELLLFRFTLPESCVAGVRLFNNTSDPLSSAAGMSGADFRIYLSNVMDLLDHYGTNYANTGTVCAVIDNDQDGSPAGTDPDDNDPCVPNALSDRCDQDSDGLTNADEAIVGTNPTVADTDGDGINDGTEVTNTSDPLNPCSPSLNSPVCDQDSDGLTNAEETTAGTNPTNPDTDGDGVNDGDEVTNGSNPLNPCSPNPAAGPCDQDSDGLTNTQEASLGTNPTNPDTDGDGINDGTEVTNGSNPLDPCSPVPSGGCPTDDDNDGVPAATDPDDNNPCVPNPAAGLCDQDNDGLTNTQEAANGTNPIIPDTDDDGINDGTEVTNGSDPLSACSPNVNFPTCDQDNDGLNNGEEAINGTNPTNPDTDGDGVNDGTEVTNGSDPLSPCSPNPLFGTCDQDGDGLTNDQETMYLTNPTNPDTDNDTINDGLEVTNGSDPLNPCSPNVGSPACDQDGDGLTNTQEALLGTNPTNPDTDGDGINDGTEVTNASDPLNPCDPNLTSVSCDQDGDGLTNGQEATIGTDPTIPDTDGDGINDGTEVTNGSNPLNACDPNPASPACTINPEIQFTVKFNPATCTYEIYGKPNFTATNFFIASGSQVGILLPTAIDNVVLAITSVNGGLWTNDSNVYAPGASPANDFHAVSTSGSAVNLVAGQELLLFTFKLPNSQCCIVGVRLFNNDTDPQSSAAGMGNGDFNNYFADIFVQDNYFTSNYNNTGTICDPCLIDPVDTPTALEDTQEFCVADLPTLADLVVVETNIKWYADPTGGTALVNTTLLEDNKIYYAAQFETVNNCESANRLPITVQLNDAPTPGTLDTTQEFCVADNPTITDIQVNETGVIWYTDATGGTIVPDTTALITGTTYHASLTDVATGCISSVRLAVTVTLNDAPTPTTLEDTQEFCLVDTPTVADIQINEPDIVWYADETGGTPLADDTALVDGTIYYASLTNAITGCISSVRLAVTVIVNDASKPTGAAAQKFCLADAPTVGDIVTDQTDVVWYTDAVGGTIVLNTAALITGATYYGSLTDAASGCISFVRLAVTVTVNDAPTPNTLDNTQDFCLADNPTVGDIQVDETGVVWYTADTGGTIVTNDTALVDGTIYYASLTNPTESCISSERLAVSVTVNDAPTPTILDATPDFCLVDVPTVADIAVVEPGVVWYADVTGGTALANDTALVDGTIYYGSLTDATSGCISSERLAVTVTVNDAAKPQTTDTTQEFCLVDAPTVGDIEVDDVGVVWYTAATGGTIVPNATALVTGTTYHASLTDAASGCISSERLAVTVTVNDAPTPETANATQEFCLVDAPTVGDIETDDTGVVWYTAATNGTIVPNNTALVDGTIYYGSLTDTASGCISSERLAVTVIVNDAPTPTILDATPDFCLVNAPTVADIAVVEAGVVWYADETGGTPLANDTALVDGTIYYGSLTDTASGCISSERLAVTVTVNDAAKPQTTDTTQEFCLVDAPTVGDIEVDDVGVVWYTAATGGTIVPNATALVTGTTYHASLTDAASGCISSERLAVTVTVNDAPKPETANATQEFCLVDAPTVGNIETDDTGVVWYTADTGGTIVPNDTALVDGTIYYGSLTDTASGCISSERLAVTVIVNDAPTPTILDATPDFCLVDAPTVADIEVVEAGVVWYADETGGTPLANDTALVDGTIYYGSLTDATSGCISSERLAVTVTVNDAAKPQTTDTTQEFCLVDAPTVGDIEVDDVGVVWYTAATGGTIVPNDTALVTGTTYHASLTDAASGCISSERLAVTVTVNDAPKPGTANATQEFCLVDAPTVGDIETDDTGVVWYTAATNGTIVPNDTALVTGTIYYGSLTDTASGCISSERLAVTVIVNDAPTPTTLDDTQDFCAANAPTAADIQVVEPGVVWYTAETGGTIVANDTALEDGVTYYGSLTDAGTGCISSERLAVTVTVDDAPTPETLDDTQEFCLIDSPTVADIQVNETGVVWYTAATGGTIVPNDTALTSGTTYYGSLTDAGTGCISSVRLAVMVTVNNAPEPTTTDATQEFCTVDAPTVADINVNQTGVVWYTDATGGTIVPNDAALVTGTTYYGSLTVAGCDSATRLEVAVTLNDGVTPTTSDDTQTFCGIDLPTIADIQVDQAGVVFYTVPTGGTLVPNDTALVTGTTYYASFTDPISGCASAVRKAIQVTLNNGTTPTTTSTSQSFCGVDSPTVADIQVNTPGVVWYSAEIGGSVIAGTTPLIHNMTYYASIVDASGCASAVRLDITVTIENGATPSTLDTTQNFCTIDSPTVGDIQVNEPGVIWYTTPTGGTPLAATDALISGSTYYGSLQTASGCESLVRLEVTVTINNGIIPSTDDDTQAFCGVNIPTVANIQVSPAGTVFYTDATGGVLIDAAALLTDGTTYYASYTDPVTGCESSVRLPITVSVNDGVTPTTTNIAQEFCQGEDPTVSDIVVNETGITWYTSPTGGVPLDPNAPLTNGTTYYASIITDGCPSSVRLAITVTVYGSSEATITGGGPEACFGDEVTYTTQAGNSGYVWTIVGGEIVAGGTASDNSVTVNWTDIGGNFVSVSYTDVNGCLGEASADLEVNVTSCSDITITKTVNLVAPNIGENVIFTITVKNTGESTFTDVVVSEELPDGYKFITAILSKGTYDVVTGIWSIPELLPGETAVMDIEVLVLFGGNYENVVYILSSAPLDSNLANNEARVSIEPSCLTVYSEFTPNGDGLNETFRIDCIEYYPNNKLEIFNRFGTPVYKTAGYMNDWNGVANVDGVVRRNEQLPVGTYFYVLEVDGKAKTGWVYIMR